MIYSFLFSTEREVIYLPNNGKHHLKTFDLVSSATKTKDDSSVPRLDF